jgi:hypothetical protein
MTEGEKAATLRLIERGRHPLLACHDLSYSVDDLICTMAKDPEFCVQWCGVVAAFCQMTQEERMLGE